MENSNRYLPLLGRVLIGAPFILSGLGKLAAHDATVGYIGSAGLPLPQVGWLIAVVMEFFAGLALVIGFYTRPLALLMALYTLATALVAHHFWTMADAARMENAINFYKNISIMGGLVLLSVTGPGKYSIDGK